MPIRLWSTVTSQLATRPLFHVTGYVASDLAATRGRSFVDVGLDVRLERAVLLLRPVVSDGGHEPAPVVHDVLDGRRLHERRIARDGGPVVALPLWAVAFCADALPLALAE